MSEKTCKLPAVSAIPKRPIEIKRIKVQVAADGTFILRDEKYRSILFHCKDVIIEYDTARPDNLTTVVFKSGDEVERIKYVARYLIAQGYNGNH